VKAGLRGFTLIEMLVGLTLLGLMTLALFSALRIGLDSWDRSEVKALQVVDLRIVEGVMRREVAKAFPLRVGTAADNKIAFEGDTGRVRFVGALPANLTPGGLSLISIESGQGEDIPGKSAPTRQLVLKHIQISNDTKDFSEIDGADAGTTVLLTGLGEIEFDYFGRENDQADPAWRKDWTVPTRIPSLVRMKFKFAGSDDTHELSMPVRLGEEAGCFQSTFQRNCGPRR